VAAIREALENGINWIDTAAVYGLGHSEEIVARALEGMGNRPYVFTKCSMVWDEGGKIGHSLQTFLRRHGGTLLTPRTVVLIISDGWDTGDIDVLTDAMKEIRSRAGRVIWLNPLLGSPGYEPICQGMRAALPYVDVFASAHNLESLSHLERHLARRIRK